MIAAISSAQAVTLNPTLTNHVIVAETYSSQGALAVIHGNVQSGTYTSVGAGITGAPTNNKATVHGNINSGTYTSTGDSAIVDDNITTGTYTSIGANGIVGGDIKSGTYTTTGASATVVNIAAEGVLTLGASTTVGGTATGSLGGPPPAFTSLQTDIINQQATLKALGGTTTVPGVYGPGGASFGAGVYDVVDILSFAANSDITLNGDGSDQSWVFNVGNYMSLGADVDVVLNNVGANSTVIWNILGDSTGGAGLGYASLGAGVDFTGVILANSYISVGAGNAMVSGVDTSCGGLYSATGYVSVGATSVVGGAGCGASSVPDNGSSLAFLGLGLVCLGGIRRKFAK